MKKKGWNANRLLFLFIFTLMIYQPLSNPITPVLAGDIDEVDGFQQAPNWRWRNVTETSSGVDVSMNGDNLIINNTNLSGYGQNYTKARRLNDRDMYFNSRFLLDVGGKFNGSEYWTVEESDIADFNEDLDTWSGTFLTQNGSYYDGAGKIETEYDKSFDYPIAHYNFNEGSGTNVSDSSGNSHHGIYEVGTDSENWASSFNSEANYSINFNSSAKQFINITDHNDFSFVDGGGDKPFSIDCWIYIDSLTNTAELVTKTTFIGSDYEEWGLYIHTNGEIRFFLREHFSFGMIMVRSASNTVSINEWDHITAVYSGNETKEGLSVFLNGSDVSSIRSDDYSYGGMTNTDSDVRIGTRYNAISSSSYMEGKIDEVRIWDFELNQANITEMYNDFTYIPHKVLDTPPSSVEIYSEVALSDTTKYHYFAMEFLVESSENSNITAIEIYDYNVPTDIFYSDSIVRGNGTNEILLADFLLSEDWEASSGDIGIEFTVTTEPIIIAINYTFLANIPEYNLDNTIGIYDEEEGFKFALLNEFYNTSLEWEFTNNATLDDDNDSTTEETYSFRINVYNSTGHKVMYSNELFEYHFTTHGWLDLEVEWNVDTKRIRTRLKDSTGRRIVDFRAIDDIFPISQLISTFDYAWSYGKPLLSINASTINNAKIYVVIDYIDSNYDLMDWIEPKTQLDIGITTLASGSDDFFTSANQFGVISIGKDNDDSYKKYYHNIDHFDAVSFDFALNVSDLDINDYAIWRTFIYNVKHDGTLEKVLRIDIKETGYAAWSIPEYQIYKNNGAGVFVKVYDNTFQYSDNTVTMEFELFYDDEQKLIHQSTVHSRDEDHFQSLKLIPEDSEEPFTKEFVVVFEYVAETDNSGYSDDEIFFSVTEYDVVRKGILGDIIGSVVNLVVGFITFLLTPIIMIFMFIGGLIVKGLQTLGKFLEPLFNIIGGLIDGVVGVVEGIGEFILQVGIDVGTFLLSLVGDFLADIIQWIVDFAVLLVDALATIIFLIWDDFIGGPDLLAILDIVFNDFLFPILFDIPQMLFDFIGFMLVVGNLSLLGFWLYALFLGFASQGFRPFEGISEFIERMLKGPDVTVLGIGPARIPIGLAIVLPITVVLILIPTGGIFAFL